jgi:hypothetical protein
MRSNSIHRSPLSMAMPMGESMESLKRNISLNNNQKILPADVSSIPNNIISGLFSSEADQSLLKTGDNESSVNVTNIILLSQIEDQLNSKISDIKNKLNNIVYLNKTISTNIQYNSGLLDDTDVNQNEFEMWYYKFINGNGIDISSQIFEFLQSQNININQKKKIAQYFYKLVNSVPNEEKKIFTSKFCSMNVEAINQIMDQIMDQIDIHVKIITQIKPMSDDVPKPFSFPNISKGAY